MITAIWIAVLAAIGFGLMVFLERVCFRREPRRLIDELHDIFERERR